MIKFYDTNVLINMQDIIFNCEDRFYISNITYKELEHIKTSHNKTEEVKYKAREAVRWLDSNEDKYDIEVKGGQSSFHQADREKSLQILMRINFLKRLESSVSSFRITLYTPFSNISFMYKSSKSSLQVMT